MTNPLETGAPPRKAKSPLNPHECCDWANARLHPDAHDQGLRWVVTGEKDKPIALRREV